MLARAARSWPALVGATTLIRVASLSEETGCEILVKAEHLNPVGSPKDRVALRAVCDAVACGRLRPGGTIVEGTSGSTGISLAALARCIGLRCEVFVQDDASSDKVAALRRLGAEVVLVPAQSIVSRDHYVNRARARGAEPGCLFVDQFETACNARAHEEGTGPEILAAVPGGRVHAFVMGAGTGGTLAGVSRALKRARGGDPAPATSCGNAAGCGGELAAAGAPADVPRSAEAAAGRAVESSAAAAGGAAGAAGPDALTSSMAARIRDAVKRTGVAVVLADPPGSALYHRAAHGTAFAEEQAERTVRRNRYDTVVEGIGLDRVTANLRRAVLDAAVRVSDEEAVAMSRRLAERDGLFLGSTSAVHCEAARQVALALGPGHTVVTMACDSGERHTTRFWSDTFLRDAGLLPQAA
ncbi:hypothetical protein FNF29_05481 [Cafeteria roenbergensis]|uniref:Tryptophan synthase beta chain-like PALP domain-containing protein n=1 Tax=Cafeteria roenbergensis TaxID=33653 RepID=A0A5A8CD95_CAFRO|nr:hypothetical protein FNF29_05481 [Cafeteria roenbergensis]|eukprot:KAA0150040.1 hypothetical protein FNF29_05481 [Cafeteria roenbergensis]